MLTSNPAAVSTLRDFAGLLPEYSALARLGTKLSGIIGSLFAGRVELDGEHIAARFRRKHGDLAVVRNPMEAGAAGLYWILSPGS